MKSQKAIRILEAQKSKIKKPGFLPEPWIEETSNYIIAIFGKETEQYNQLMDLDFKDNYPINPERYKIASFNGAPLYDERDLAVQFIDSLIEYIDQIGLPKIKPHSMKDDDAKKGLFISNTWLSIIITIIVALIGASFVLGLHFGSSKFDMEKEELFRKNQLLENELSQHNNKVETNVRRYVECPCLTIGRLALLLPITELLFGE